MNRRQLLALVAVAALLAALPSRADDPVPTLQKRAPTGDAQKADGPPWLSSLADGTAQAQRRRQPVFVRVGSESCQFCRKLEEELRDPKLREELTRWTLVALDADRHADDARTLTVSSIPALRLLTPTGRVVASLDAYHPAEKLAAWLKEHYDAATGVAAEVFTAEGPPDAAALAKLVAALPQRDPAVREAAVRRLLPHPTVAASPVAEAFADGPLQAKLSALELLTAWEAPVAGLDPWRPETLVAARVKAVKEWAVRPSAISPKPLSDADLVAARGDLTRLAQVSDAEAAAIRERLARHGPALMAEVYERLKSAPTDLARERFTALRYRLVARDGLALTWPGGLERLASADSAQRHQAVQDLARRVTSTDEALLLELFSSADPLIRELSLRALHAAAGKQANTALTKLLSDPEPNVRAAVLKQLAEKPSPALVPKVAEYAAAENDHDLVVHAVRVLRSAGGAKAIESLKGLLQHASWRVRAEAVHALGEIASRDDNPINRQPNRDAEKEAEYAPIVAALGDADGFVVGRAVAALKKADIASAVEPLVKAVETHPDLATEAIATLGSGSKLRDKALPHLKKFAAHPRPGVRVAALKQLRTYAAALTEAEVLAGLKDADSTVRTAAAQAVFAYLDGARSGVIDDHHGPIPIPPSPAGGLLEGLGRLFGGGTSETPKDKATDPDGKLAEARAGKGRVTWLARTVELLEPMLSANDAEERLAAALCLVAFGRDDQAVSVVRAVAEKSHALLGEAAKALTWLPWAARVELYHFLLARGPDGEQVGEIVNGLVRVRDRRALPLLWAVAGRDGLSGEALSEIVQAINTILYDGQWTQWSGPVAERVKPADRQAAIAVAKPYADAGPELRRLIALLVMRSASREEAHVAAEKILADAAAPAALKRDAFQIRLITLPRGERKKTAAAALTHADAGVRNRAALYLAGIDVYRFRYIRDEVYLDSETGDEGEETTATVGENAPFAPRRPDGVTPEAVRPLIADKNPETAAAGAYLLALCGDPAGLDALVRQWPAQSQDEFWTRLVCRAVTALDDDSKVSVLDEVYQTLGERGFTAREFYWTIRALEGPNALRLRKQIRQDVGMDALRAGDPNVP